MGRHQLVLALSLSVFTIAAHGRDYLGNARTVDVISSYGYIAKDYNVTTEDGYILSVTHIKSSGTKPPVLMLAGVLAASDMWVLQGPKKDLALLLVDAGHDVWLGNYRGNCYSLSHTSLNTTDPQFWNFSFHEIGLYDIPAMVDFVLAQSGSGQLQYVGHSMGCAAFLVTCSMRPMYNSKIKTAILLSPVAFKATSQLSPVARVLIPQANKIKERLTDAKVYKLLERTPGSQQLLDNICIEKNRRLCMFFVTQTYGPETAITDLDKLRTYLKRIQSGASVKTLAHLAQIYKSKTFSQFDYGKIINLEVYNSQKPPPYLLEKVTCPVAIFYSDKDVFLNENSITRLKQALPNVIFSRSISGYNHIDLIFADSAAAILYKSIVILLK